MRGISEIHEYVLKQNQLAEAGAVPPEMPEESDEDALVSESGSAEIDISDVKTGQEMEVSVDE